VAKRVAAQLVMFFKRQGGQMQFSRRGVTPAAWVERVRVDAARGFIEAAKAPTKQVAALCGFSDTDTLRRAFLRQLGVTPAEYRRRHAG
jgi:transcriptional regulator GlxA family with amidase domain